ncbi:MAG: Ig-like domain-containing protein [Ignavibacteriales bacterium]|nr:Ig-like domain-containing protein [Ignavibacteriales bacterium]
MRVLQKIILNSLLLLSTFTIFNCAGIDSPSGGPPDKNPPTILKTYPKPGELNYNGKRFSFSFNKYINRRSLEESFFVSPPIGDLEFEWDGKDLEVVFQESLRPNTTYIITLGTDLTDIRGNKLLQSYTVPFSSSDKIDSASIAGIVNDDKPEGIMIFAYPLELISPDTLNPAKIKPVYVTQTGKNGSFVLPFLKIGSYRIFAIRDEYKNLLYDAGIDQYGVTVNDISLSDSIKNIEGIQFKMAMEDTTPPFLSSVRAIDDSHILLRLSESIDWHTVDVQNVSIEDTLSKTKLDVLDLSFVDEDNKDAQVVTKKQDVGRNFRVWLSGWKDESGNAMLPPLNTGEFASEMLVDTSIPKIDLKNIKNRNVNYPVDDSIKVTFNEPIIKHKFEKGFQIVDSTGTLVDGKFMWEHSAKASFIPTTLLFKGMKYTIKCVLDSIEDYSGNSQRDSVIKLPFQTVEDRSLSGLKGTVFDERTAGSGRIHINVSNVSKKDIKSKNSVLESSGSFSFDNLFEGKYIINLFRDSNGDGKFTYGKIYPYVPAERYTIYPDTLKLRARWPLEGISLKLK